MVLGNFLDIQSRAMTSREEAHETLSTPAEETLHLKISYLSIHFS